MAIFNDFELTNAGINLLGQVSTGQPLIFTKIKLGDGNFIGNVKYLADLFSIFKEVGISDVAIQEDDSINIKSEFNNDGFSTSKEWKEIGIFAKAGETGTEVLYSYSYALLTVETIPAEATTAYRRDLNFRNYISDVTNVTYVINVKKDKYIFNTIADLQSSNFLVNGDIVELLGYYEKGDGAGHKRIVSSVDDGSGIIVGSFFANIIHSGTVFAEWFGAIGDSITDNTINIKKMLEYPLARKFKIGKGIFVINSSINIDRTNNTESMFLEGTTMLDTAIKYTGTGVALYISCDRLRIDNLEIIGKIVGDKLWIDGSIGLKCDGVVELTAVRFANLDVGYQWTAGYYQKFYKCFFTRLNICADKIFGNNFLFESCRFSIFNTGISITGGDGNIIVTSSSIEDFREKFISQSSGSSCSTSFCKNYVENYEERYTGTTGLKPVGGAIICSLSRGEHNFDDNNIQTHRVFRGFHLSDAGGYKEFNSVYATGNKWKFPPKGTLCDMERAYFCSTISGKINNLVLKDNVSYAENPHTNGKYPIKYFDSHIAENVYVDGFDPVKNEELSPDWKAPALLNGWENISGSDYDDVLKFKLHKGILYIKGAINGSSATLGTVFNVLDYLECDFSGLPTRTPIKAIDENFSTINVTLRKTGEVVVAKDSKNVIINSVIII